VEVTAIGTGGKRYALAFIEEERVPFPVLLDSDGEAAQVVGTKTLGLGSVVRPGALIAAGRSLAGGNRQGTPGKRPLQLGATLVIGPGDELLYADFEDFAGDHAPLDEVLAVLAG